jgi:hypothetical protein
MESLPIELFDMVLEYLDIRSLRILCESKASIESYCILNKHRLLKNKLKDVSRIEQKSSYSDIRFLFNTDLEMMNYIFEINGIELLNYLTEQYPVNENNYLLHKFGIYVSENWEKYIDIDPEIVLLWLEYRNVFFDKKTLDSLYFRTPKKVIYEIINNPSWFNTKTATIHFHFKQIHLLH